MNHALTKRDCGIGMRLIPYGAGWSDVYLQIGGDDLRFILSSAWGDDFTHLLRILCFLHPDNCDPESMDHFMNCWEGVVENGEVVAIVENMDGLDGSECIRIPWKAKLKWEEEGAFSQWTIEREPTLDTDFDIRITIDLCRKERKRYEYTVRYKDFCYAVAKTCTEVLKSHGIYGYHHSVYSDDMHVRYLLFIKSVALDCPQARTLTDLGEGKGYSTSLEKELELLLFDM